MTFAMALNPVAPVTDYQSMLNRIGWFTSIAALGALYLLRRELPVLDAALARIDSSETGLGNLLPSAGSVLPALAVGMSTRVFRTHSHLGHWLGIRERFDIDVILATFSQRLGLEPTEIPTETWQRHRHDLMHQAFYRYANSQTPQIDLHLIHQALDLWSWFWIGIEAALVFVITSFVLIAAGSMKVGLLTFASTLALTSSLLPTIRLQCKRAAIAQVRAIMADPTRAAEVLTAFEILQMPEKPLRRAA